MAKPTKQLNGTFKIQVFLGTDVSGKKHITTLRGFSTASKAQEAAENARVNFRNNKRNVIVNESLITLKEYYNTTWWPFYEHTVGESTWNKSQQVIKDYVLNKFGDKKLKDISPKLLNPYIRETWLQLINYTVPVNYFRQIMQMAVSDGLIQSNPFDNLQMPKKRKIEKKRKSWSRDEVDRIISIMPKFKKTHQMAYTYLYLLLLSALRKEEANALKWSDIDFETGKITIERALKTGHKREYVGTTKNESSKRSLILPADVLQALHEWRVISPAQRNFIFTTQTDKPINLARPYKWVTQLEEMAQVPHLGGTHVLRHTFATMALEAGVNPKVVQAQLGHATSEMTMNVYAEVDASKGINAGDKIISWLRPTEAS